MKVNSNTFDDNKISAIECLRNASRKKYIIKGRVKSTREEKMEERNVKRMEESEYDTSEKR